MLAGAAVYMAVSDIFFGQFYFKDGTFYSKSRFGRVSVLDISSVCSISLFSLILSPEIWLSTKFRFLFTDICFWRKGVLIGGSSGKRIFVSVFEPDKFVDDINALLKDGRKSQAELRAA